MALVLLAGCSGTEVKPPRSQVPSADARAEAAQTLLRRLATRLSAHDYAAATDLAAADPMARKAVRAIAANAKALRVAGVRLDYVEAAEPSTRTRQRFGEDAFAATVTTSWRLAGVETRAASVDTVFEFVAGESGVRLVGTTAGIGSDRGVLWLQQPLQVRRGQRTLVLAATDASALGRMADRAIADVRRVLRRWRGALVIEMPRSQEEFDSLLGAAPGEYASIAAVTTTVDGSDAARAPVHVFVNPEVFGRLGPRGAQVVLSHEAVHVATDASRTPGMPAWLVEGFADYVALRHARIGVRVAARQALARVRRDGPPRRLPTGADLSASASGLGATYESAWTAVRFMGERYGERSVVRFHDSVRGGTAPSVAFRQVLGVRQAQFVRDWRRDLVRLAR